MANLMFMRSNVANEPRADRVQRRVSSIRVLDRMSVSVQPSDHVCVIAQCKLPLVLLLELVGVGGERRRCDQHCAARLVIVKSSVEAAH